MTSFFKMLSARISSSAWPEKAIEPPEPNLSMALASLVGSLEDLVRGPVASTRR